MSIRQISDDESTDELDGKFIPSNYSAEKEAKMKRNKQKFKEGIRKKRNFEDLKEELSRPPKIENDKAKIISEGDIIEEVEEKEEQTVEKSDLSSGKPPLRVIPTNTSAYFAGSDSAQRSGRKPITQIESELSLREPGDEYISASGEDLASDRQSLLVQPKIKKSVKFEKAAGIPPSSSEDKEIDNDEEFIKSLTSRQDFLNLGSE